VVKNTFKGVTKSGMYFAQINLYRTPLQRMFFRKLHPLHTTQVGVQIIHLNSGVFFSKYTLPWGVLFKVHSASEQVDLI